MDRAVLASAAGAVIFVGVWSLDDSPAVDVVALAVLYLGPFTVGWYTGWWSVVLYPIMMLAAIGAANEWVAPDAWSGGDMPPFLFLPAMFATFGALLRAHVSARRN